MRFRERHGVARRGDDNNDRNEKPTRFNEHPSGAKIELPQTLRDRKKRSKLSKAAP